jgi:hypothetical protein
MARSSVLRRVMTRFAGNRGCSLDLAQLFGVPFNRFAIDKKLIVASAFNAHAIRDVLAHKIVVLTASSGAPQAGRIAQRPGR